MKDVILVHDLQAFGYLVKCEFAEIFRIVTAAVQDDLGQITLHQFKKDPNTFIEIIDIFASHNIRAIKGLYKTALVDDTLTFGETDACVLEHTLVIIGDPYTFENGGEASPSNSILDFVEVFRTKLLYLTGFAD